MKKILTFIFLNFYLCISFLFSQVITASSQILYLSENSSGTLLAVSDENYVTVYDTSDFSEVCVLDERRAVKTAFYSEAGEEYLVIMTKAGQLSVRKIERPNGYWHYDNHAAYFSADCADLTGYKSLVTTAFSNRANYIAAAFSDNTVQVHFLLRGIRSSITKNITSHHSAVYGLEFSHNGEYLASVSNDGIAYIWSSSNCSKITQLRGIYTRSKIPVYFSEDSSYLISQDSRNSFRISDFSGSTLYSVFTGRAITAIKPLKDPDLIAVRNDNDEVMVYSISSRRPLSISAVKDEVPFTVFEFNYAADCMYAGFKNGVVRCITPEEYLEETEMLVTDTSMIRKKSNFVSDPFTCLSICGGANYMAQPYLFSANLRAEYLYSKKISPFVLGLGLQAAAGFPGEDFPATYKIEGVQVDPPYMTRLTAYVPIGYSFRPRKGALRFITDIKSGATCSCLAMVNQYGYILGKPEFSFFVSAGAGVQIKFLEFDINCEYDTIGGVSPSAYTGLVFRWGETK